MALLRERLRMSGISTTKIYRLAATSSRKWPSIFTWASSNNHSYSSSRILINNNNNNSSSPNIPIVISRFPLIIRSWRNWEQNQPLEKATNSKSIHNSNNNNSHPNHSNSNSKAFRLRNPLRSKTSSRSKRNSDNFRNLACSLARNSSNKWMRTTNKLSLISWRVKARTKISNNRRISSSSQLPAQKLVLRSMKCQKLTRQWLYKLKLIASNRLWNNMERIRILEATGQMSTQIRREEFHQSNSRVISANFNNRSRAITSWNEHQ